MPPGKLPDVGYAVGNLPTDGVERFEAAVGFQLFDFVDYMAESFDRLGRLRVKKQFFVQVYFAEVLAVFDDDGLPPGLSYQPVHFGVVMTFGVILGNITPPVGMNLYVGCAISGISFALLSRAIMPFIAVMIGCFYLISYVPAFSTCLL